MQGYSGRLTGKEGINMAETRTMRLTVKSFYASITTLRADHS